MLVIFSHGAIPQLQSNHDVVSHMWNFLMMQIFHALSVLSVCQQSHKSIYWENHTRSKWWKGRGSLLIKAPGASMGTSSANHAERSGRVETHGQIRIRSAKSARWMSILTSKSGWMRGVRIHSSTPARSIHSTFVVNVKSSVIIVVLRIRDNTASSSTKWN